MSLSKQQLSFFHENGYIGPFTLFSETEAHKYDHIMTNEKIAAKTMKIPDVDTLYREQPLKCANMHLYNSKIYRLASSAIILDKIEQLLGKNFLLWRTIFWGKPHNCCAVPWHKDIYAAAGYGIISNISCWVALSEVTEKNGCLEFIQGSHKEELTQKDIYKDNAFKEDTARVPYLLAPEGLEHRVIKLPLKKGQFVIFDQKTLHGSGPNTSIHPRKGLVMRYAPTDIEQNLKVPCMIMRGDNTDCRQRLITPPSKSLIGKFVRKCLYGKKI